MSYEPPPGPPDHVIVAEFILGLVACLGLAALAVALLTRADVWSVFGPLAIIALNAVALALPAAMGHRSFSAGFVAGYGVLLIVGIYVCFAFVEI